MVQFVDKERLTQLSQTGRHQGVIAYTAAYEYAQVEDMLALDVYKRQVHTRGVAGSNPVPATCVRKGICKSRFLFFV